MGWPEFEGELDLFQTFPFLLETSSFLEHPSFPL
jgi:hypothetical protein